MSDRYEITWTKNGDKGGEEPEIVVADSYGDAGGFIDFHVEGGDGFSVTVVLRVRASDVQSIRKVGW